MRKPTSLKLRLTLLFCIISTTVFLTFGWLIERSINEHFAMEDIKELNVITQAVEKSLLSLKPHQDFLQIKQRFDDILVGHHAPLLNISNDKNTILYRSSNIAELSSIPIPKKNIDKGALIEWSDEKHSYRVLIKKIKNKQQIFTVIVAVATDFHLHFLIEFQNILWLMVTSGILIMGVLGWFAIRHGHKPLHNIVEQISQINAQELNTRLSPDAVPAELTDLAISFNELLHRLETSFNRLSHFSDDIAHELRTPITNLMTQTQVAMSKARSENEYKEILYSNMEEYERMAQMIRDMLFLAKAENGIFLPNNEKIMLDTEVLKLFDFYEALAEEKGVILTLKGKAKVSGDSAMISRAINNLLSNALRHTPNNGEITITLSSENDMSKICIKNPGEKIADKHLPHLFDRFYRIDPSRHRSSENTGLGLSITKSIIDIHHGEIVANSNEDYTAFTITRPT